MSTNVCLVQAFEHSERRGRSRFPSHHHFVVHPFISLSPYTLYTKHSSTLFAERNFYCIVGAFHCEFWRKYLAGARSLLHFHPTHELRATQTIRRMRDDSNMTPMRGSRMHANNSLALLLLQPHFFIPLLLHSLRTHCIYSSNLPFASHVSTLCGHLHLGSFCIARMHG